MPEQADAFANFDAIQKLGPDSGMDETSWVALNHNHASPHRHRRGCFARGRWLCSDARDGDQPESFGAESTPFTSLFRRLLSAPEQEQQKLLAQKPAAAQELLQEKLEEYRGLDIAERQRRLHLLDLRWYITQLRYVSPSNRLARLATIPQPDRKLVEERLAIWDALTAQQSCSSCSMM
jgi:hypothetical protein